MSDDANQPQDPVVSPAGARYAIVWSRFNQHIVGKLLDGATSLFEEYGVKQDALLIVEVPGAWELAHAAKQIARGGQFHAVVALGAVIRGGTPHFDYVAGAAADGLARAMLDTGVPVVFGVLTTDDDAQAHDRAGGKHGNKGREAALTAIEMVSLDHSLAADGITKKRA